MNIFISSFLMLIGLLMVSCDSEGEYRVWTKEYKINGDHLVVNAYRSNSSGLDSDTLFRYELLYRGESVADVLSMNYDLDVIRAEVSGVIVIYSNKFALFFESGESFPVKWIWEEEKGLLRIANDEGLIFNYWLGRREGIRSVGLDSSGLYRIEIMVNNRRVWGVRSADDDEWRYE